MKNRLIAGLVILFILTILFVLTPHARKPSAMSPLSQDAYVWQRQWSPAVGDSIQRAKTAVSTFYVFAGEVGFEQNEITFKPTPVDWTLLGHVNTVTPVLRATTAFAQAISSLGPDGAAKEFSSAFAAVEANAAKAPGLSMDSLQIDYDCPTEKIGAYADFLQGLRALLPGKTLSITTLPSWLTSDDFAVLARSADFLVLQVHGTEMPRNMNDPVVLCDAVRARQYAQRIAAFNRDFYVALPTYTYEVLFSPGGELTGIAAEGSPVRHPGQPHRFLSADPAELSKLVSLWQKDRPDHMRGLIWFRLPVDTDRQNWSWPVLQSVMQGMAPETRFNAELRSVRPDLRELWVTSLGPYTPRADIRITVHFQGARIKASDAVNGFALTAIDGALTMQGPAPDQGTPTLAAWWVTESETNQPPTFAAGNVNVIQ